MEKSVMAKLFVFSFCAIALVSSLTAKAANFELPLKGGEKLSVNVPQANLQITANPNLKSIKVQMNPAATAEYGVYSDSGVIEVRKKESISKDSFIGAKPEANKFVIEIQSPSMPLEIHLFDGQVQLSKWGKEALVHLQKGKMIFREGNGTLAVHGQSGDISILDHQGRVDLDVYKANLTVKNLNGDADLENFAGDTNVDKSKGFINLSQDQGSAKITGSSGTLKFEIGKATLSSQNFSGRVEGLTQEGPINILMSADDDVNVKSQSGRVTVHSAKSSGASLNLATVDGDISGPSYLKVNRESGQKTLRGRLNGDAQKGSIIIRSLDGGIVIR